MVPRVTGPAKCGRRTKDLARRLQRGDIAVIAHENLDSVGAQMLVDAGVSGVVNLQPSISGRYPNRGPGILLDAGVLLLDIDQPDLMDALREGTELTLEGDRLMAGDRQVAEGELQSRSVVDLKLARSRNNLDSELQRFAENTLHYASRELTQLLAPVQTPAINAKIQDKHVLVVVRGDGYKRDLEIIRGYLMGVKPVIIAVDGGADAMLEMGMKPDIILGDMDSVSDKALRCGAEIVVHTYADGRESPGLQRVQQLGLEHQKFSVPGTSEDAAMLLAFEYGAELIVAVGTHSNLYDFLDKGRHGMASTILVRMRIGSRLVDARGVSKLYPARIPAITVALVALGIFLLFAVILLQSDDVHGWLRMIGNSVRLKMLEWRILGRS
ncbi:MAG: hypothetical protein IT209_10970 [Armatimonadetes bacterium]|nr:hypothetical protein [Armatimonadota bacterium]